MIQVEGLVGGAVFKRIKSDERVNENLSECLYCVVHQYEENASKHIDYRIPLDCIGGNAVKQCPACKTIYILKDPTE